MKTVNQLTNSERSSTQTAHSTVKLNWFDKQAINFENARFGWMAMLITAQSCLGSVACGFILKNDANILVLCACAAITMGCNALLIALAPPKVALVSVYLSVILNSLFILFNL